MKVYIKIKDRLCKIDGNLKWSCENDKELEDSLNAVVSSMLRSYLPVPEYHIALEIVELYKGEMIGSIPEKGDRSEDEDEEGNIY